MSCVEFGATGCATVPVRRARSFDRPNRRNPRKIREQLVHDKKTANAYGGVICLERERNAAVISTDC